MLALALRAAFVTLIDRSGALRALIDKVVGVGVASYLAPLVLAAPIFAVLYTTADWPVWFGVPTPDTGFTPKIPALVGFGTAFAFGWILHRQADVLGVLEKQWLVNLALAVGLTSACLAIVGIAPNLAAATVIEGGAGMRAVYTACYTAGDLVLDVRPDRCGDALLLAAERAAALPGRLVVLALSRLTCRSCSFYRRR